MRRLNRYPRLRFLEGAPEGGPAPAAAIEPAADPAPATVDEGKTFTQADVDRIIAGRLSKYSDYDDLKAKVGALEESTKTDLEREIEKARSEARAEVQTGANARLVAAEVRALAAELAFRDPADALAQLSAGGKLAEAPVGDDGSVDGAAVKAELEALAKSKPYLLKEASAGASASLAGIGVSGASAPVVTPGIGRLQSAYANSATK